MSKQVALSIDRIQLPDDVTEYIRELDARVQDFVKDKPFAKDGFVACDHTVIAKSLIAIQQQGLATGQVMCEWGSGFGGVASIAALLGFESYGIEINEEVLQESIQLAREFEIDVEFIGGSFIPVGADDLIDDAYMENEGDLTLESHFDDAYQDLGKAIDDFDLIFVFPWPNEAPLLLNIFNRFASDGAMLLTYNDFSGLTVERK